MISKFIFASKSQFLLVFFILQNLTKKIAFTYKKVKNNIFSFLLRRTVFQCRPTQNLLCSLMLQPSHAVSWCFYSAADLHNGLKNKILHQISGWSWRSSCFCPYSGYWKITVTAYILKLCLHTNSTSAGVLLFAITLLSYSAALKNFRSSEVGYVKFLVKSPPIFGDFRTLQLQKWRHPMIHQTIGWWITAVHRWARVKLTE